MPVNAKGLAIFGAGALFTWSGIKGWSVLGTLGDLVTGHQPAQPATNSFTQQKDPNAPPNPNDPGYYGGNIPPELSGVGLAAIASQYKGHAYHYGGAPGLDGSQPWDCSSFVNFCAGIRMSLPIPGYSAGSYKGDVHGPPTGGWLIWPGLKDVNRDELMAGDLIIWANHMGVAVGRNTMVSALNETEGTKEGEIDGAAVGPILRYGRYDFSTTTGGAAGHPTAR